MKFFNEQYNKIRTHFWNSEQDGYSLDENGIKEAIRRALSDFTCRTKKLKNPSQPFGKEKMFTALENNGFVDRFIKYFSECNRTENEFDRWHEESCDEFLRIIGEYYEHLAYGKAQKIVNMTFKNAYCLNGAEKIDDYFKYCHFSLDSFTLEWLKRSSIIINFNDRNYPYIASRIRSWSRIEKEDKMIKEGKLYYFGYMDIIRGVRELFKTDIIKKLYLELTPFQAEFIIWKQIQFEMAIEAVYGQTLTWDEETLEKELEKANELNKPKDNEGKEKKVRWLKDKFKKNSLHDKNKYLCETLNGIATFFGQNTFAPLC